MKGQAWSIDIIIAVVLFVAAFMFFYVTISGAPTSETTAILIEDGEQLATMLTSDTELSVVKENKLSDSKVIKVSDISYEEIRRIAGLKSDFCIHFEDESGNIINVTGVQSIGNSEVNITFKTGVVTSCGQ